MESIPNPPNCSGTYDGLSFNLHADGTAAVGLVSGLMFLIAQLLRAWQEAEKCYQFPLLRTISLALLAYLTAWKWSGSGCFLISSIISNPLSHKMVCSCFKDILARGVWFPL